MRSIVRAVALLLSLIGGADAATLISTASGNINSTGTWSVVDTTGTNALLNSETANTALTTSPVASSTFTPAAETVTAIGVKLASVAASPTGTMTVKLANSTSPGTRECTQTVNVSDLPTAAAATAEGGWVILTCSASPNGTDAYTITANTSSSSQVNLFSLATTNWSRLLVTSGTQAGGPAAADSFIVEGQLTGAGTHSAFTVTVNTTANINYGNVANTLVSPSIAVGQFGTLAFGTTSATNFVMEVAGPMVVYNGGTFTIGTSGTPVPMSASCTQSSPCATLTLNTTTEGDTGIVVRNGGTFDTNGAPRTAATCSSGMACVQTHLNSNVSAGAVATLNVTDATGWISGDKIAIASTALETGGGSTQTETAILSGNATSTTLPVTGTTLGFSHLGQVVSYTSSANGQSYSLSMQAEIILLTRNVRIQGSGNSTPAYIYFQPTANLASAWTEFQNISGKSAGQFGLDSDIGAAGSFSLTYFSFHDAIHGGVTLAETNTTWGGTAASPATVQYGGFYNDCQANLGFPANSALVIDQQTTNTNWLFDNLTVLDVQASCSAIRLRSISGQFSNIVVADNIGAGNVAILTDVVANGTKMLGTWGPLTFHSNATGGIDGQFGVNGMRGTISAMYTWHSAGPVISASNYSLTFNSVYALQASDWGGIGITGDGVLTVKNGFLGSDSTARPPILIDERTEKIELDNMELCPPASQLVTITQSTGMATGQSLFVSCTGTNSISVIADESGFGNPYITGRNTSFLSTYEATLPGFIGQGFFNPDGFVCSEWGTTHECFTTFGALTFDTAIHNLSSASVRLTPQIVRFTGSIAPGTNGTGTLTVTGTPYPSTSVNLSLPISGAGVTANTIITAQGSGSGGAGTYTVNNSQTVSSETMTGLTGRLQSAPPYEGIKAAVASGGTTQVCVWVRESVIGDANGIAYNGDAPRLIERANPQMGVNSDTVLATYNGTPSGTWGGNGSSPLCGTSGVAPQDGIFEFVVDADMTSTSNAGGWVNVADWSCSAGCINPKGGQQFWFNAVPFQGIAPSSGGGGASIIGG